MLAGMILMLLAAQAADLSWADPERLAEAQEASAVYAICIRDTAKRYARGADPAADVATATVHSCQRQADAVEAASVRVLEGSEAIGPGQARSMAAEHRANRDRAMREAAVAIVVKERAER